MKQPKNSVQLPEPTADTRKIQNKLMTVIILVYIRNIFPLLMFQQLLVNKHHRLRDSKSRTRFGRSHRRKLRHSNSGREKFGLAYRQKKKNKPRVD